MATSVRAVDYASECFYIRSKSPGDNKFQARACRQRAFDRRLDIHHRSHEARGQ